MDVQPQATDNGITKKILTLYPISAAYSVFSEGPKALQFQIGGFYFPSQTVNRQWNKPCIRRDIGLCVFILEKI